MNALVEALRFVRSRIDVALLEIETGDVGAAILAIEAAAERLDAAVVEARDGMAA